MINAVIMKKKNSKEQQHRGAREPGIGLRSNFTRTPFPKESFPDCDRLSHCWDGGDRTWCPLSTSVTAGLTSKDTSVWKEFSVEETTEGSVH